MIATNRKNVWVVRPLLWVLSLLIAATPLALAASIPNERVRTPAIENTPCLWAKAELTPQRHWVNHDAKLAIAQESRLATRGTGSGGGTEQWKKLSNGEINKLKRAGHDVHELKGRGRVSRYDLYKDKKGDIYIKPKDGSGQGEWTGLNIYDF